MKLLSQREEHVMLAVWALKDDAYLVAIKNYLSEVKQKNISLTSIHLPLSRLETDGLVKSAWGEATAVRGGRRKKIYQITPYGLKVLEETKRIQDALWQDYKKLVTS